MSDFRTRLLNERTELNERIDKLEAFRRGDKFSGIAATQRSLLGIQIHAMLTYSQVLDERIADLDKGTSGDPAAYYANGLNPSNES